MWVGKYYDPFTLVADGVYPVTLNHIHAPWSTVITVRLICNRRLSSPHVYLSVRLRGGSVTCGLTTMTSNMAAEIRINSLSIELA